MEALRPFTSGEMSNIGEAADFAPVTWSTMHLPGNDAIWGIPWISETYVVHYHRDLLHRAGIDETTAFSTHAQIDETCARLSQAGIDLPSEIPYQVDRYGSLHTLASWVWAADQEFCNSDGSRVFFDRPTVMAAMRPFLALIRHTSPKGVQWLRERQHFDFIRQGRAAIGLGMLEGASPYFNTPPEVIANWGTAPLPQPCFAGGINLVVWAHTNRPAATVELVRFFTTPEMADQCAGVFHGLSPRRSALGKNCHSG
jgi:ABC-type glycerol-3-phosphate transport system substrate-binding protein